MAGSTPFGCGQCLPCRINRRRQWQWRQFFESLSHNENCFVTLTYNEENLPDQAGLEPEVVSLWLKRFRKQIQPLRVRYFLVGEYGDISLRPHYHLSLFGVSGFTVLDDGRTVEKVIASTWGRGFVQVAEFNEATAQYVSGYVTKKMTQKDDPRLEGRFPEFARMSNRPGLGAAAMLVIAETLVKTGNAMCLVDELGDVPKEVRIGKRSVPLGRYLLRKLREAIGFRPEWINEVKQKIAMEKSIELLAVFQAALNDEEVGGAVVTPRSTYLKEVHAKILQVEGRYKIRSQRRSI